MVLNIVIGLQNVLYVIQADIAYLAYILTTIVYIYGPGIEPVTSCLHS